MRPRALLLVLLSGLLMYLSVGSDLAIAANESDEKSTYEPTTTFDPQVPIDQLRVLVKPLTKSELESEAGAWFELLRQKARQIAAVQLGVKKTNEAMASESSDQAKAAVRAAHAVETQASLSTDAAEENQRSGKARQQLSVEQFDSPELAPEGTVKNERVKVEPPTDADLAEVAEIAADTKEELLTDVTDLNEQRTALADRLEVVLTSLEAKGGEVSEYRDYVRAISGIDLDAQDASATWAAITGWISSKEGGQRWLWNLGRFVLILAMTCLAAKVVAGVTNWLLEHRLKLSQLAEKLISRMIKNVIYLIGFAIALTALEIDITPIIAAIGAAGFIIAFALQGTLSNFASGLMILVNRPFDVGDVVTAGGVTGTVHEMNLVSTKFLTFDNQTIYVPNNEIWGNVITNITANDTRRVDMEFGIGYDDDFEEAERIIREVVDEYELVLKDPEPVITLHELGDSAVNIVCRPWAKTSNWWTVKTQVTRRVKQRFDEAGISIPYPQTDIHVYQHDDVAAS